MKICGVLLTFLISASALGEPAGLTLEGAKDLALKANPRLQQLSLQTQVADAQTSESFSTYMPHLAIAGNKVFDQKFMLETVPFNGVNASFPAIVPYTQFGLTGSLTIFDGLEGWNRYQAAKFERQATDLELSRGKLRLDTEVRTKFYQALGAQALVDVTQQNISTLEQHLNDISSQIRGGVSTKFDSLRIEVQLEDARAEKMHAEDELVIARAKLWQALGEKDDGRPLQGSLPSDFTALDWQHIALDPAARDDRKAQALQTERSDKMRAAAKGFWFPQLTLYGSKDWYNNINRDLDNTGQNFQDEYALGLRLTWNIYDGGLSLARAREEAVKAQIAQSQLRELDDQIPVDFELWKRRLGYSIVNYHARQAAIAKSTESVRLARNGVKAGIRTNTEVLDAELDLNQSKAKAVRAQVDAVEAWGNLELALGKPLS